MRLLVAALLTVSASAGCVAVSIIPGSTCASLGIGGASTCAAAGASLGCTWDGTTCNGPAPANCGGYNSPAACNAVTPAGSCLWNDPNVCDAADILSCTGSESGYMKCLLDGTGVSSLTSIYANLTSASITADLTARINANVDRMMCSCMSIYFQCIYDGDCGRDALWQASWATSCGAVFSSLSATRPGLTACDASWCSVGKTNGVSTFTVKFTFDASNLPSTWTQAKKDAFAAALRAELSGVEENWLSFNAATGTATVTIPSGTTISTEQMASITAAINGWKSPQTSQSKPVFDAAGVQGSEVTSEPAPVQTRASSGTRAAASFLFATVAVVLAMMV